jgi:hypothetical protein
MLLFSLNDQPYDLCNSSRPYTVVPGGRWRNGGDIGAWGGILPIYTTYTRIIYIYKNRFSTLEKLYGENPRNTRTHSLAHALHTNTYYT